MDNKQTPLPENDDDISLDSLMQTGRYLLVKCFYFLSLFLKELKRTWYIIFVCVLIGAGLSYFSYVQKERNVLTGVEMLVVNNILPKNVYGQMMDNLNTVISASLTDQVAKELNVNSNVAENIVLVRAISMQGNALWGDTSAKTGDVFKIIAEVKDAQIKDTLQKALLNYMNSNAYLALIQKSKMEIASKRIALIDKDLAELDSVKKSFYKNGSRTLRLSDSAGVVDLFLKSNILLDKKDSFQDYINTKYEPVMLVDGFKGGARLEAKSALLPLLVKSILSGLLIGIFCCIIIMFLRVAKNFQSSGSGQ
jgi:hypothetical protein